MNILGISCFYHDAAATLLVDGKVIAAAEEERFTRQKHDSSFPFNAIRYCLSEGKIGSTDLNWVAFYERPWVKFHRLLESYLSTAPRGLEFFRKSVPWWRGTRLWTAFVIRQALGRCGVRPKYRLYFTAHHEAHAASAFYPSPFEDSAVLTVDGVGEWATATIAVGNREKLEFLKQLNFPHSLGLLYSAFTHFTGFRVNSGEYEMMGLAPYGESCYTQLILDELLDLKPDGSFRLNMKYFGFCSGFSMTTEAFDDLFGGPPREPGAAITRREMDIARSIQDVVEEVVARMAGHAADVTHKRRLCMAGGVALNCVANAQVRRRRIFDDIWVQPAAGDSGGSLGACFAVWHRHLGKPRFADGKHDLMKGSLLGPSFNDEQIRAYLDDTGCVYRELDLGTWPDEVARLIADQYVVGLFQGRLEFGPRALGSRSILADARSPRMQAVLNSKIKYREAFRPFAPSCLEHRATEYFDIDFNAPYMLFTVNVRKERTFAALGGRHDDLIQWVEEARSDIPAVTHVDFSARVQTVNSETNPGFAKLLEAFEARTGCSLVINTSFNLRGEPIVCTPADAYRCFMRSGMDYLVMGSFLLSRQDKHGQDLLDTGGEFSGLVSQRLNT